MRSSINSKTKKNHHWISQSMCLNNFLHSIRFGAMVVLELLKWKAPACLILMVVLLTQNQRVPQPMDVQWCEFFAGEGQVSLALWSCNLKGSSHDLRYSKLMDLCTDHGFAHLDCMQLANLLLEALQLNSLFPMHVGNISKVGHQ